MPKTPNPFESREESDISVLRPKRPGDPFEASCPEEAEEVESSTLIGRADFGASDPKPLLEGRADEDLVEWMLGVGRFFAAAGVALCRGSETPELARSRDRALRWAMSFDILDEALRTKLREQLEHDDRREAAPAPMLLEASRILGNPDRRLDAERFYALYGFSAGEEFAADHLGRELLFYGLILERLHACGAAGEKEAVEALFADALDFLAQHLDWLDAIADDSLEAEARMLLRVTRAVVAAERSLTIA